VWEAIWTEAIRERLGRDASLTAVVFDSQSLRSEKGAAKTTPWGTIRPKKVMGHKVHALVDAEGLPLRVVIHSAAIQDSDGAALVIDKIRSR
jgi:hypothetical protein